jgi:hypothetical protein
MSFSPPRHVKHVRNALWVLIEPLLPHLGHWLADAGCAAVAALLGRLRGGRVESPPP